MKVVIEKDAQNDVEEIANFYERSEQGAGAYFIDQFHTQALELRLHGGIHSMRRGFHFCQVKNFPIGIYYRSESGKISVCAVIDCRRKPSKIQRILRKR